MLKRIVTGAVAVFVLSAIPARADVRVTMHDGRVSVVAKDATLRQILTEWARAGQARIVNAEQVAGGPMTIELTDVPERQALDILMRAVGGYLAAPRATPVPNAAFFDRIIVLPTAAPRSTTASSAPAALPQPRFQPTPIDDDQRAPFGAPTPQPIPGAAPQLAPAFQPPIQSPAAAPGAPAAPTAPFPPGTALAPAGTSRPGMIVQPPTAAPAGQPAGRP